MHRIFRTANFRLVLVYAAVFSSSVFILGVVVFYSIRASLEYQIKTQIELDATQLMGDYRDDGIDELRHDIHERIEANPANRLLYSIQSQDGRIIFDKILPKLPPVGWHKVTNKEGKHYLLHSMKLRDGYQFAVASDMEKAINLQSTVRNAFAIAFALSLIFGVTGGLIISRRFLARVDSFNRIAEDIGQQGALERRLPVDGSGDDFDQMAGIVNVMLGRIQDLVVEIRQVTTSIAHDLRTPLGQLRQKLEDLGQSKIDNVHYKKKHEEALSLLDETLLTFSALLHLAEIESGINKRRFIQADLNEIISSLVAAYHSVAEEEGLTLIHPAEVSGPVQVRGDKRLLTQLFVNLIENAIRHAGKGAVIEVQLEQKDDRICVSVADNGPGVPTTEWTNILKPFYRLDTSRNSRGSGLGLSFVSAIAKLHNAQLTFEDNGPGLKVVLTFIPFRA